MVDVVKQYNLGIVSAGFTVEQIVESLNTLTTKSIATYKQNVDAAARELSFDKDAEVAKGIIGRLLTTNRL